MYDEYFSPYWYSWKLQIMNIQQEIVLIFMDITSEKRIER